MPSDADALEDTRRVLHHLGHDVTDDLAWDVDRAIDRERERRHTALVRIALALGDDPDGDVWFAREDSLVHRVASLHHDVVSRLDPLDEAGQRRRIDELAARAFGPAYRELHNLVRAELNRPADPWTDHPYPHEEAPDGQ